MYSTYSVLGIKNKNNIKLNEEISINKLEDKAILIILIKYNQLKLR